MLLLKSDMLADGPIFIIIFNILRYNASQWTMIYWKSKNVKIVVKYGMPDSVIPYQATIQLLIKFIDKNISSFVP